MTDPKEKAREAAIAAQYTTYRARNLMQLDSDIEALDAALDAFLDAMIKSAEEEWEERGDLMGTPPEWLKSFREAQSP